MAKTVRGEGLLRGKARNAANDIVASRDLPVSAGLKGGSGAVKGAEDEVRQLGWVQDAPNSIAESDLAALMSQSLSRSNDRS